MVEAEIIQKLKRMDAFLQCEYPDCVLMPAAPKSGKIPRYPHVKKEYTANMFKPIECTERYVHQNEQGEYEVRMAGAIILLGKSLIVVDVDDEAWCTKIEHMFPDTFPHTVICKTCHGKHYYFTRTPYAEHIKDGARKLKDPTGNTLPIDVKTVCSTGARGVISVPPSHKKEWVKELGMHKPLPIPDEFVDFYNKHMSRLIAVMDEVHAVIHPIANSSLGTDYVSKLLHLLSKSRWDDRNQWRDIAIALQNHTGDGRYHDVWLGLSKISHKFDEAEAKKVWNTCIDPNYQGAKVTLGTIELLG